MAAKSGTKAVQKQATKRRTRRKPYEGGPWAIGGVKPYVPLARRSAIELAQRRQEVAGHFLPFAEARAAEGRKWYPGMVAWYEAELQQIDALLAAQATTQKRARRQRAA